MKNKNLFEDKETNSNSKPKSVQENKTKSKKDGTSKKIVQNDYNMGTYDFENLGDIKIHSNSSVFTDNFFDAYEKTQIREILYKLFEETEYKNKYEGVRRIQKNDVMDIFYIFYRSKELEQFSCIDRFTESCNFLNFDYKYVYYNLLPNEKEQIVKAMDEEFGILKSTNIKKLF